MGQDAPRPVERIAVPVVGLVERDDDISGRVTEYSCKGEGRDVSPDLIVSDGDWLF